LNRLIIYLSDVFRAGSAAELSCLHHHDGVMVEPLDNFYLSDVFSAERAAELSCLHHHDGVMVEPLDDVLMNNVLILALKKKQKNLK
jgi:hypothetical protein